ncbi:MAG TPA: 2-phospho-L-lactate guanylyltransferase [Ktedonobacteraceae bacterium]|jgi:2-phospho-L-lactate guanylyltransferase|nr:2-phospho-L-lactate guanylyltransferase [Ktedonobacteraceae bacterium]
MNYRALIPVKSLHLAKSRLAPHLAPAQRAQLMLDMLHHTLRTLQATEAFERISIVSADPSVLAQVEAWGAIALPEAASGHNPALRAAAQHELATGASVTTALLTISGDLPLLCPHEVKALLALADTHEVVLAPSQEGTGTNAFLARPPLAIPYVFGVGSLQRFSAEAQRRHKSYTLYHSLGLSLDIDTRADLEDYLRHANEDSIICVR